MERLRKDRQREGIDAALAKGAYSPFQGRPTTIDADRIKLLRADGLTPTAIGRKLGIARSSVYRHLG
jgi:DNA invertase Pin-like site-specific DNA recombinase